MIIEMEKESLLQLNLSELEVDIYWSLLLNGRQSVYKLAKDLKIPRSSMYGYVDGLVSKGFLNWSIYKKGARQIEAVQPEKVKLVFELEKQKLSHYEDVLGDLGSFIKNLKEKPIKMDIRYYEGVSGLEQIIWNTLSCKSGNMYGLSDWDRNYYLSNSFIELHMREAWKRGPKDHIITRKERVTNVQKHLEKYPLEIKVLSSDKFFVNGDTYIYDDIFAATIVKDGQIFGFEIQNELFAKLQLSTFMLLWDMAKVVG